MKLSRLIKDLDCRVYNYKNINVKALACIDTACTKGCVFFAIPGLNNDGAKYVNSAINKGATVIVCSGHIDNIGAIQVVVNNVSKAMAYIDNLFYSMPHKHLQIIGVTGSNGKTTTAHMLYNILRHCGNKVGLIGTLGTYIDGIHLPSNMTTPDPIELNYLLHQMVLFGCKYAVMEVSAHAIDLYKMCGIMLEGCIFTNISNEHLDYFKTMRRYAMTKVNYFCAANMRWAIVNMDDKYGRLIAQDADIPVHGYGLYNPADTFAINIKCALNATKFVVNIDDQIYKVCLPMGGEYNVYNAMAAMQCAHLMGCSVYSVVDAISKLPTIPGRLEVFSFGSDNKVVVDFAHTPDGFEKVLGLVSKYRKGRIITLFGCVGYSDTAKRHLMGQIAIKYSDVVILTTDNSDNVLFDTICDDIGLKGNNVYRIKDRIEAIKFGVSMFTAHDTLVCLGKGGETKQRINGKDIPYDEIQIIRNLKG